MTDLTKISVKARNFKCFGSEEQGFEKILPVNLIIGRNNTGKSALLDIIQYASSEQNYEQFGHLKNEPTLVLSGPADKRHLNTIQDYIRKGVWTTGSQDSNVVAAEMENVHVVFPRADQPTKFPAYLIPSCDTYFEHKQQYVDAVEMLTNSTHQPFAGYQFRRLSPDRDIVPEQDPGNFSSITLTGRNATTLFHHFLNKDNLPSDLVEKDILKELNYIFEPEGRFTRILTQQSGNNYWEVYLEEVNKGRIRVADSGHGVKTVLLVLACLYLVPAIEQRTLSDYMFGFEELENNLHPSLQRRLLTYLHEKAIANDCHFFLTTHSHVAIDLFANKTDAQILHLTHNGEYATVQTVTDYLQHRNILDDLDVRASDLLQSNCIVWVEGPSDRVYFNKWVEIFSDAKLQEGVHYQCFSYGGKLLSHLQAIVPTASDGQEAKEDTDDQDAEDLVNLMNINKHAILLIDSDRSESTSPIHATKERIATEITKMRGFAWITQGREVENYIPQEALASRFSGTALTTLGEHEDIKVYLNSNVKVIPQRSTKDNPNKEAVGYGGIFEKSKVNFAHSICKFLAEDNLSNQMDLETQMQQVCKLIREWNKVREGS